MNVRLKRTWPGSFRRSVRVDGNVVSILEWKPGDVMAVTDEHELTAIKDDIGKALEVMPEPVVKTEPEASDQPIKGKKK